MSLLDSFMRCFDRLPSKRKLDDYGAAAEGDDSGDVSGCDDSSELASFCRTRRLDENPSQLVTGRTDANSAGCKGKCVAFASSSHASSSRSFVEGESSRSNSGASEIVHFFVNIGGRTANLHFDRSETISTILQTLQSLTRMNEIHYRLIFHGKQLQSEQTLEECLVENDTTMYLVSRMRSTSHPLAFQVTEDIVSTVLNICKSQSSPLSIMLRSLKRKVEQYIDGISSKYLGGGNDAHGIRKKDKMYKNVITSRGKDQVLSSLSSELWLIEYLKVFLDFDAPKALVALYRSLEKANRDIADECIQLLINMVHQFSNGPVKAFYATILLEFCKLLMPAFDGDGGDDLLYLHCRCTLGSVVKIVGVAFGPEGVDKIKYFMTVQDLLPLLGEVVNRLKKDLAWSVESNGIHGPLYRHASDFSSLLQPLWALVEEQVGCKGRISSPNGKGKGLLYPCWEEIMLLHVIFTDLCGVMDQCLEKMEKNEAVKGKTVKENFQFGWSQYLPILKQLNSIATLYQGAEDHFWNMMRCRKASVCALIVRFAKRIDDHEWLFLHKDILDFESRKHLAMLMLPEVKEDYEELHEMLIDRSQLLAESFEYISHADPSSLQSGLFMEFKNEEATGPGVLREWFLLVCQAIFDPEQALFVACPLDRRRFFPNPASKVDPLHLEYFRFSGRVIALALMHKVQIGTVLDRVFFVQLTKMDLGLEDIKDADPYIYSSCKQILEMDPEYIDSDALGLTFVREFEELGSRKVVELCEGGKDIVVNSKNRHSYVKLLIQHCFVESISEQVSHFSQGFVDIISSDDQRMSFFKCLELEDLDGMLHGSEFAISIEEWKAHTEYHGYKSSDPEITWFWEVRGDECVEDSSRYSSESDLLYSFFQVVSEMSEDQRKILLFFWTSVKYLPVEGFRGLASRLYIYKSMESPDHLPSSHTCFFRLCLPPYPSKEAMQERLKVITKEHIGRGFGTW